MISSAPRPALTPEALVAMKERCARATPGPWHHRAGRHTPDFATADAGGIHTSAGPVETKPNGEKWVNDNVLFPVIKVNGPHRDKLLMMMANGMLKIGVEMDVWAKPEDLDFICTIRSDAPYLFALIADLLDVIANPPTWTEYTTPAWRSVATSLRKGST